MDVHNKLTRSHNMSQIRGRNTRPEVLLRKGLFRHGFRYRLHDKTLPGKPDLVFPKYRAIILVQGCFWHGHDCHLFKWPKSHQLFWRNKISATKMRDSKNIAQYEVLGWKVLQVWECSLKGKSRRPLPEVLNTIANWIRYDSLSAEIRGHIQNNLS